MRLVEYGVAALPGLAVLVSHHATVEHARVWGIIAISQIGDDDEGTSVRAVLAALGSESARVRWSALHALGSLRAAQTVTTIADHLDDHTEVERAWFEDDCRVSDAAAAALECIGTEDALRALAQARAR